MSVYFTAGVIAEFAGVSAMLLSHSQCFFMRSLYPGSMIYDARPRAAEVPQLSTCPQSVVPISDHCFTGTHVASSKTAQPMSNDASLVNSLKVFTHYGSAVQEQRHGSLAATNIPPTPETSTLGPRVEHLSAAADSALKSTIANQLKLPEVSGLLSLLER